MEDGVIDQLRMAREYALLGNYETSLVYYDGVVATIQRTMRDEEDPRSKSQWQSAKEEIQSEAKLIKEVVRELSALRRPPGSKPVEVDDGAEQPARGRPPTAAAGAGGGNVARRVRSRPSAEPPAPAPRKRAGAPPPAPSARPSRARKVVAAGGKAGGGFQGGGGARPGRARVADRAAGGAARGRKSGVGTAGGRGRRGKAEEETGEEERPPYSEAHSDSPDLELIRMIERDILESDPNVRFEEIAGLEEAKGLIQEAVVLPMIIPDYFQGIRRPWKGVLMFGPPGTGKTMLAKAVATECNTTFFNVTATTLASKWRGESEKLVRILFDMARYYAPSTVFFDEIDSLAGSRGHSGEHEASRRVKTELLVQMDGLSSAVAESGGSAQVVVIAATNLPWELDEAFRRRLEKRIYIPLPNKHDRVELMRLSMRSVQMADDVNLDALAELTEGYSGADLAIVCRDAAMMSMRKLVLEARRHGRSLEEMKAVIASQQEDIVTAPVTQADFLEAVRNVSTSVGSQDLKRFQDWMTEFGAT